MSVVARRAVADPRTRAVVTSSLLLGLATGVFAISFGVGSVAAGASVAQTCVMSLLVFTGASQFSLVSVIGAGGSAASALGGASLLAARNAVYGLAMAPHLRGAGTHGIVRRLVAAQITIDESTAMALAQSDPHHRRVAFWITGVSIYVCWNLGTLVGALAGSAIDPETFGLDAAFPAAFVAMVWPLLADPRARLAAVIGGTTCLVLVPFVPVGVPILCASLAIAIGIPAPSRRVEQAESGPAASEPT